MEDPVVHAESAHAGLEYDSALEHSSGADSDDDTSYGSRRAKKRQRGGADAPGGPEKATAESGQSAPASDTAAAAVAAARRSVLPSEKLLRWSVTIQQTDLVTRFFSVPRLVLDDAVTFYVSNTSGFRGLMLDTNMRNVVMTVGRLFCPVVIYSRDESPAPKELSITVDKKQLNKLLAGLKGYHHLEMYQKWDDSDVWFAVAEQTGRIQRVSIPEKELDGASSHHTIRETTFTWQLSLPVRHLKETLRKVLDKCVIPSDLQLAELRLQLCSNASVGMVLKLTNNCEADGRTEANSMGIVGKVMDVLPLVEAAEMQAAALAAAAETTSLKGDAEARRLSYDDRPRGGGSGSGGSSEPSDVSDAADGLSTMNRDYDGLFRALLLDKMLSGVNDQSQLKLFLTQGQPLLMRLDLDIKEADQSFILFVLADMAN